MENKKPKIRLLGFSQDWKKHLLRDCSTLITKGTTPLDKSGYGNVNFIKVENIIDGKIVPKSKITMEDHEGYLKRSRLEKNDILFSIAGTLGRTAQVSKSLLPANTNQALAIIRGYNFDSSFLITTLEGRVVKEYIRRNPTIGAQPNLSLEQVGNLIINAPTIEEQTQIGLFFKKLINNISLHKQELETLKQTKQGFLQKMFPKEGEFIPQVRFPGFNEEWEKRKLNEILKERKVKKQISEEEPLLAFAAGQGVIDRKDRKTNNRDFLTKDSTTKKYLLTKFDDIVYNPANVKYGAIDRNKFGQGVISPIYVTFETVEFPAFIELIVKSENFKQRALQYEEGTVTKRQSVKPENLLNLDIVLPSSKEEQVKIGEFFIKLDKKIELQEKELKALKETKKAFLQKMFV